MNKLKLAVLVSALAGTSVVFAQQTPPAKPAAQGAQTAQTAPQPGSAAAGQTRGGMSAGAGQTAAGTSEVVATVEALVVIGAVVAGVAVIHSTNSH